MKRGSRRPADEAADAARLGTGASHSRQAPPVATPASNADGLADLRQGGHFDSVGHFSIDARKAQLKMQHFGFVDLHEYVLGALRAAVAAGATRVDVEVGAGEVSMTVRGWTLEPSFFDEPLAGLFIDQQRQDVAPYRLLAVAINAALGLRPSALEIEAHSASLRFMSAEQWERAPGHETLARDVFNLRVQAHLGWEWASRTMAAALGRLPESRLLRQRASGCPIELRLNGAVFTRGGWQQGLMRILESRAALVSHCTFETPQCRGLIALNEYSLRLYTEGTIIVLYHGVVLAQRRMDLRGAYAIVYADRITTNASMSDVVEDDAWQAVIEAVHQHASAALDGLYAALKVNPGAADLRQFALRIMAQTPSYYKEAVALLADLPLFRMLDSSLASLRQLRQWASEKQGLYYLNVPLEGGVLPQRVVILGGAYEKFVIETLPVRQLPDALRQKALSAARASEVRLPRANGYLFIVPIQLEGFSGELGLPTAWAQRSKEARAQVTFFSQSRRICTEGLDIGKAPFDAVIDHRAFAPNETWDHVEKNDIYRRGLEVLARCFVESVARHLEKVAARVQREPLRATVSSAGLARGALECMRLTGQPPQSCPASLANVPLFRTVEGLEVSLATVQAESILRYVRQAPPQAVHTEHVVLSDAADLLLLAHFMPGAEQHNVSNALAQMLADTAPVLDQLPPLPSSVRFCAVIGRARMVGRVGLRCDGKTSDSNLILARAGVTVGKRALQLPYGPLEAVVWSRDTHCDNGGRLIADEGLQAVLDAVAENVPTVAQLAATSLPDLKDTEREVVLRFLLSFMAASPGNLPPAVRRADCFRTLGDRYTSYDALMNELQRHGGLRYVRETLGAPPPDRPVLLLPKHAEQAACQAIFGVQRLLDATVQLRQQHERDEFYRRPIERPQLPHPRDEYARVVEVKGGSIGVLWQLTVGDASSRVVVLRESRRLGVVTVATAFFMEGFVNRDDFEPDEAWSGPAESAIERVATLLREAEDETVRGLLAGCAPHSPQALLLLRYALVRRGPLTEAIDELPLLSDSTAQARSLRELRREVERRRALVYTGRQTRGAPLSESMVWALDHDELKLLETLASNRVDYSEQLAMDVEVRRRRDASGGLSLRVPPGDELARLEVDGGGLRGELAITPGQARGVQLAYRGVPIEKRALYGPLPVIGVIEGDSFVVNASWREVTWDVATSRRLSALLDRLFERALANEQARPQLYEYMLYRGEQAVSATVARANLFPLCGGGRTSLAKLLMARRRWGYVALARREGDYSSEPAPIVLCGDDVDMHDFVVKFFGRMHVRAMEGVWPEMRGAAQQLASGVRAGWTSAARALEHAGAAQAEAEQARLAEAKRKRLERDRARREHDRQREERERLELRAEENRERQDPRAAERRELLRLVVNLFEGWSERPRQFGRSLPYKRFEMFALRSKLLVVAEWPNVRLNTTHALFDKFDNDAESAAILGCAVYDAIMLDSGGKRTPQGDAEWSTWVLHWLQKNHKSP